MSKRSTILGFALLVLLLTAGTAQGLSGSNTVESDDIIDGAVTKAKLAPGVLGCKSPAGPSFATVDPNAPNPAITNAYTTNGVVEKRNCSGSSVEVKRASSGVYCVKFVGSTQKRAVVSATNSAAIVGTDTFFGSSTCEGGSAGTPGVFKVLTRTSANVVSDTVGFTILAF